MVSGSATIQGQGGPAVIVNQSSSSAIINWNTFNIGANESVCSISPRVRRWRSIASPVDLGPSEILGSLTANGRIFLINRDGILFGPGAVVNTAGFLATTHDIKNSDFMAGRYIPTGKLEPWIDPGWNGHGVVADIENVEFLVSQPSKAQASTAHRIAPRAS